MTNSEWKQVESLPTGYTQLRLFPLTDHEILLIRMKEVEQKLERQRKAQFGKIGRNDKKITEVHERLEWIEKWICETNWQPKNTCEVLEMVGQ